MHDHRCWRRRDFLKTVGTLAAGAGLAPCWAAGNELGTLDAAAAPADVGIARGSNMEDAVRRAVRLAGGLDFIRDGQTVLIKPNVTGAAKNPTTMNPEVLYATIKLIA